MNSRKLARALARALAASTPCIAVASCTCPTFNQVKPIAPAHYESLHSAGKLTTDDCRALCGDVTVQGRGGGVVGCAPATIGERDPAIICTIRASCVGGRRPAGLARAGAPTAQCRDGEFFASLARLEAASVDAFLSLARELACHGAPPALVTAAVRAARNEVEHAHITTALAARHGAAPHPADVAPTDVRRLFDVALDNVIEGCVNETYGAITCAVQAGHASDPAVRRAMRKIARDELSHARLADRIDRWIQPRLTGLQRRALREARAQAHHALRRRVTVDHRASTLGLPTPEQAAELVTAMM